MSFWDKDQSPEEWFRRFIGSRAGRFGFGGRGGMFREFDDVRREMERMFEETVQNFERVPKELVREYETPTGGKVREVGPLVYGYSVTMGPDGKPQVREFGNVRSLGGAAAPQLSAEREPLADVTTTDKEIKVIVELPGASKESIKVDAYDGAVEISADTSQRKYRRMVDIPPDADIDTAKSSYNNGILEITFSKKARPKGRKIDVT